MGLQKWQGCRMVHRHTPPCEESLCPHENLTEGLSASLFINLNLIANCISKKLISSIQSHSILPILERTAIEEEAIKSQFLSKIEKIHYAILKSLSFAPFLPPVPSEKEPILPWANVGVTVEQEKESSENLQKLVDNVLSVTQLSTGFFSVNKKPESIYELLDACKINLLDFLSNSTIDHDIQPDIPLVMIDFSLVELLICNLLIHAAENSPEG